MKLGMVFEGGASRTYFSTGVMDFFLEEKLYADYVIGVSAGIANAISYVSRQHGRNIEIAEKFLHDKRYMGMRHMLNPKKRSYYNVDFVFKEIPEKHIYFDNETFKNSDCETLACVTNIETGKAEYMPICDYDTSWNIVVASCSLPLLFQPVKIGYGLYLDGGITEPLPVDRAIEDGCDKIIVVTTREKDYRKTKESGAGLSSFIYQKYPRLVECLMSRVDSYNRSRAHLYELEKEGRVFIISPKNTKQWGRTDSDPQKLRAIHNHGHDTAKQLSSKLYEYLEK